MPAAKVPKARGAWLITHREKQDGRLDQLQGNLSAGRSWQQTHSAIEHQVDALPVELLCGVDGDLPVIC